MSGSPHEPLEWQTRRLLDALLVLRLPLEGRNAAAKVIDERLQHVVLLLFFANDRPASTATDVVAVEWSNTSEGQSRGRGALTVSDGTVGQRECGARSWREHVERHGADVTEAWSKADLGANYGEVLAFALAFAAFRARETFSYDVLQWNCRSLCLSVMESCASGQGFVATPDLERFWIKDIASSVWPR